MIKEKTCYTVECDYCGSVLEDYTEVTIGIADTALGAAYLARQRGWEQTSPRRWKCPRCIAAGKARING